MITRTQLKALLFMLVAMATLVLLPQFCMHLTMPPTGPVHYLTESEIAKLDKRFLFITTSFARFEHLDSLGEQFRFDSTLADSVQNRRTQQAITTYRKAERLMNAIIQAIPPADTFDNYFLKRALLYRALCRSKISHINPDQPDTRRFRYAMQVDSIRNAIDHLYAGNGGSSMQ